MTLKTLGNIFFTCIVLALVFVAAPEVKADTFCGGGQTIFDGGVTNFDECYYVYEANMSESNYSQNEDIEVDVNVYATRCLNNIDGPQQVTVTAEMVHTSEIKVALDTPTPVTDWHGGHNYEDNRSYGSAEFEGIPTGGDYVVKMTGVGTFGQMQDYGEGDKYIERGSRTVYHDLPFTVGGTPPPSDVPDGYTKCANEDETCSFSGEADVMYGAFGQYNNLTLTDGTECTNEVFGDPNVGTGKYCYYKPIPPPVVVDVPDGYTKCADEGGTCSFTDTASVVYGAFGNYNSLILANGTQCTNEIFGDPLVGTGKACYFKFVTAVPPPSPTISDLESRPLIRSGDQAQLTWSVTALYPFQCVLTGSGVHVTYDYQGMDTGGAQESYTTAPQTNTSIFNLTCSPNPSISGVSDSSSDIRVDVIPNYYEI